MLPRFLWLSGKLLWQLDRHQIAIHLIVTRLLTPTALIPAPTAILRQTQAHQMILDTGGGHPPPTVVALRDTGVSRVRRLLRPEGEGILLIRDRRRRRREGDIRVIRGRRLAGDKLPAHHRVSIEGGTSGCGCDT